MAIPSDITTFDTSDEIPSYTNDVGTFETKATAFWDKIGTNIIPEVNAVATWLNDLLGDADDISALASKTYGPNQKWITVTNSRSANTTYTNSTSRPISLAIQVQGHNDKRIAARRTSTDTWLEIVGKDNDSHDFHLYADIPAGWQYRLGNGGTNATIVRWVEFRNAGT